MDQQLLMSRQEAASFLGMSLSHFQRHVQAEMPSVRSGRLRLYRKRELEAWADRETDRKGGRRHPKGLTLEDAHSRFVADCKAGIALNKRGRRYKAKAIIDLDSSLKRLPSEIRLALLDDLKRGEVQGAVDEFRREGLSSSRIASIVNAVRSLYRWAICREMAFANPAVQIQLPACDSKDLDRIATPGEFAHLIGRLAPADALPYALAAYGTARSQEIRALCWPQVDLARKLLLLADDDDARKSETARRIVPIARPLQKRLEAEWVRQGRPKAGRVCPPRNRSRSGMVSLDQLQKRVIRLWESSGHTPIRLQESRHTAATWLDHAGVTPKLASAFMGHKAPARHLHPDGAPITLRRYTHVLPGELERPRISSMPSWQRGRRKKHGRHVRKKRFPSLQPSLCQGEGHKSALEGQKIAKAPGLSSRRSPVRLPPDGDRKMPATGLNAPRIPPYRFRRCSFVAWVKARLREPCRREKEMERWAQLFSTCRCPSMGSSPGPMRDRGTGSGTAGSGCMNGSLAVRPPSTPVSRAGRRGLMGR
jgi:excisionase family DNA binding protein